MSMITRFHKRRDANRRARQMERALRAVKSREVRDEIRAIASRHYY